MTTTDLAIKNILGILGPQESDIPYISKMPLRIAILLRLDSYKFAHPFAYPSLDIEGYQIEGMSAYGEARVGRDTVIIPFDMQMLMANYFQDPITMEDIDMAEQFAIKHFGAPLFRRKVWERVVNEFGGLLPITIRAVPEGTKLSGSLPIYNVSAFGADFAFMASGVETILQRGIWYGSTVASMDYAIKKDLVALYKKANARGLVEFALHDFGGRGVACSEQAEIGGAAHLVNFMGSDTVEGILSANYYYNCDMAAFSVYATEHSVQCSYGKDPENQVQYIYHQLKRAKDLGLKFVSIVLDGYDVIREAEACCNHPLLRDAIIEFGKAGGKTVFRPDSGDMMQIVPRILRIQETSFGYTINEGTGYRLINYVGIIQGDGVEHITIRSLEGKIMSLGFSPDCVIFGSGGALLQKLNRDTFKFAQKASAVLINGEWVGCAKDPITDPGKKSKEGVMTTVRSRMTGELMAARLDQGPLADEWEDLMKLVYHNGQLYNETSLADIRERAKV